MQKPNVSDTSLFICQLPQDIQDQIKQDVETHAYENGYILEIDEETNEYVALSRRFCDIDDMYFE